MKVAVVLPVKDGAAYLPDCLAHVREQTHQPVELIIVVAPSSDETREMALELGEEGASILDNQAGDRGSAINRALEVTDADAIAMVDAQALLAADYLETAITVLQQSKAAVVGGPMRPVGRGPVGEAMAACLGSPFAIGDSQFHFSGGARDADSVYLGVFRAEVFRAVGRYNPALLRTEDDDMNARVRQHGFRIHLDPAIRSDYRCRGDLRSIWRQYFGYGFWKVALLAVRPTALRIRHLIPAAFVVAVVVSAVVSLLTGLPAFGALAAAWLLASVVFAYVAPARSVRGRMLFPVVAFTIHLAYGSGFLLGLASLPSNLRSIRAGAETAAPTGTVPASTRSDERSTGQ